MNAARRKWLLGAAFVATLLLVWFAPEDQVTAPRPVAERPVAAVGALGAQTPDRVVPALSGAAPLDRRLRAAGADSVDLFKTRSWYVPPPPPPMPPAPPAPPPPPPPSAPPLPFAFFGQVADEQGVQVVLTRGDRIVTTAVGQDIDKNYRLESYEDGMLTFVYIPLDIRQTLPTGVSQ